MTTRNRKKVSVPKTYIAVVLDRSDSMHSYWNEAIQAFNNQVEVVRKQAGGQEVSVSLFTFSNNVQTVFFNADPNTLKSVSTQDIRPNGSTALFDGVGQAIELFKQVPDANDPNVSFLIVTITDGEENNSRNYFAPNFYSGYGGRATGAKDIVALIKDTQRTDKWTYVFQVPPGAKSIFARMGIPSDNIREWNTTRQGAIETDVATQGGLTHFFAARSTGQKSVSQFYVETDMSKVKTSDVKKVLTDESDRFKMYEVTKEVPIKEFVEEKTKQPYVIGSAYYLLMKKETVQPRKGVLIMEKKKKAVWAGREARDLIGLPDGVDAKVEPGNHANFDIYVQSTSVNRKLVRGTKVLVDTKLNKNLQPTWNHLAVK